MRKSNHELPPSNRELISRERNFSLVVRFLAKKRKRFSFWKSYLIILAVVKVDSKGRSLSLNSRPYQVRIVSTIRYSRYLKIETKMSVIVKIRSCSSLHASFLGTKMAKERQGNKLKREELRKFRGDEGRGAKELPC